MAANQYYPWGTGPGANVVTNAALLASTARINGVVAGTASSALANAAWRQSSVVASTFAQFVADTTGLDVNDDGDVAGLNAKFKAALAKVLVTSNPPLYVGSDTSSNPNLITAPVLPILANYAAGIYIIKVNNANNGLTQPQMSLNGLPNANIVKKNGGLFLGGEWSAGDELVFGFNGSQFTWVGDSNVTSTTINLAVPSQYPTIQAAVLAAERLLVLTSAYININVAAGYIEYLTAITGPIYLSHPFGQRCRILGPALNGAFPTASNIAGKSNAQTLAYLQTVFQAQIQAVGTNAIELHSGAWNSISNLLISGDQTASGGHYGIKVGDWSTEVGMGSIGLRSVWVHGFGLDNIRAEQSSVIQVNNVGSTYSTAHGFHISHYSVLECNVGNILAMYNQTGVALQNYGMCAIDSASGTVDLSYNQDAVASPAMGEFMGTPSTGLRVQNNTRYGFYMSLFSSVGLSVTGNTTFSGNGSFDVTCNLASIVATFGCGIPGGTSPSRGGGVGNTDSYVL